MDGQAEESSVPSGGQMSTGGQLLLVNAAFWSGLGLALVGFVGGVAIALRSNPVECPDGTMFPADATDFSCHEYPQALEGTVVAVFALMLGLVITLGWVIAKALLDEAMPARPR